MVVHHIQVYDDIDHGPLPAAPTRSPPDAVLGSATVDDGTYETISTYETAHTAAGVPTGAAGGAGATGTYDNDFEQESIYEEIVRQCGPRVIRKQSPDDLLGLGFATEHNEIYASLTDSGIPTVFLVKEGQAAWKAGIRFVHAARNRCCSC